MKTLDGAFDNGFEKIYMNNVVWNEKDTIWVRIRSSDYLISDIIGSNQIITNIEQSDGQSNDVIPKIYALSQNYPNPFNPTTTIKYSIAPPNLPKGEALQHISLNVYDMLGREIATLVSEEKQPGNYEVKFDGSNFSSGIYFYRIQVGSFKQTKKLILLK